MKIKSTILAFLMVACSSQEEKKDSLSYDDVEGDIKLEYVDTTDQKQTLHEKYPGIIGGNKVLDSLIGLAKKKHLDLKSGKVYVRLLIDKDGKASEFEIAKGINSQQDSIALNIVKSLRFKPAVVDGRKANVRWLIPIHF